MVTRTVPTQQTSTFERAYIWPGSYLAKMTEIKEYRDDGERFIKTYTDRETGDVINRDALVLIFELIQPVGPEPKASDGSSTKDDRIANIGETIGKKVTDSLHEKSNLYGFYSAITGEPPAKGKPVELSDMLEKLCIVKIEDNSIYGQDGKYQWRSYVLNVTQYIPVPAVTEGAKSAAAKPASAPRSVPPPPPPASRPSRAPVPAGPPPSKDPYDNVPDDLSEAVDF